MGVREIKTTLAIDGERALKAALDDAYRSLRVLGSEMKLTSAEFGKSSTSVEALTKKGEVLSKQVDQQKEIVKALAQAVSDSAEAYGESDKRTDDYRIKLNNATAALVSMEKELGQNSQALAEAEKGLTGAEEGADGLAGAVDGTGRALNETEKDLEAAGRGADELGKAVDGAGKEMGATGKEVSGYGKDVDDATKKTSVFGDVLKASLTADALKAGIKGIASGIREIGGAVRDFLSDSSKMASGAAESQTLLTQVMRNTMDATDDEVRSLIELAAAQEKVGVVSETAQVTALAELASFVERKDALEDMLPVMNDYIAYQYGATASSDQARNVATALGKAIQGNIDGLAKQGFTLSQTEKEWFKTATEAERVAFVMDMVGESMGGVNAALAQTDEGKMTSLNRVLDNTKIKVGQLFNATKAQIMGGLLPSVSALSEAFLGVVTGEGSVESLAGAFSGVFSQIMETIRTFLPKALELGSGLIRAVVEGIAENIDIVIEAVLIVVDALSETLTGLLPTIMDAGTKVLLGLVDGLIAALPFLIEAAMQLIMSLAQGLADALPTLVPVAIDAVLTLIQTLMRNLPMIIKAGLDMVVGLVKGIVDAIPKIIEAMPMLIQSFVEGLIGSIAEIIAAGVELTIQLIAGIIKAIPDIIKAMPRIISAVVSGLVSGFGQIVDVGKDLIRGLWEGIKSMGAWIGEKVGGFFSDIFGGIKNLLGIRSPSTVMAALIGKPLGQGVAVGVEGAKPDVDRAFRSLMPDPSSLAATIDVERRFSAAAGASLASSAWQGTAQTVELSPGALDWLVSAFRAALRELPDSVIVVNDRVLGRTIREVVRAT